MSALGECHATAPPCPRDAPAEIPGRPTVAELLAALIATLHAAYETPPDRAPLQTIQGRIAVYGRLRERGFTREQAAREVCVSHETARRYETRIKAQKGSGN